MQSIPVNNKSVKDGITIPVQDGTTIENVVVKDSKPVETVVVENGTLVKDAIPYLKDKSSSFRTKGITYIIKNQESDDTEEIYPILDNFYEDVLQQSKMAEFQAGLFKLMNTLSRIFIILAGAVCGILSIIAYKTTSDLNGTLITITVLSFSITVLKTLSALFTIEKKSIMLKESAIRLRKLSREIKKLKTINLTNVEIFQRIDAIQTELDEIDITMFSYTDKTAPPQPQQQSQTTDTVIQL